MEDPQEDPAGTAQPRKSDDDGPLAGPSDPADALPSGEVQRAVDALKESERRWAFAVEGTGAGVLDWDIATGAIRFSDRWLAMTGYRPDDLAPQLDALTSLVHPEDLPRALADLQEVLEGRKPVHAIEHRLRHKEGHWLWVQSRSMVSAWSDRGEPLRMVGTHVDITERRRAENALRDSESRFRTLIDRAPIAIGVSRDGIGLYVNQKFLQTFGLDSVHESVGRPISEYVAPPSREEAKELIRRRAEGLSAPTELETLGLHKNGSQFPVHVVVAQVPLSDGMANVAFLADITERKRAEKALRDSEERHRAILDTAMDGFWLVDAHGHLREVNETYCRMSGYTAQELLSMSMADLDVAEAADHTASRIASVVAQGEDRFEARHRRKDGSVFDVEVSVQYRPADGGLVAFLRDITTHKHAAAEKVKLEAQLQQAQKMESVGRLAGGVAHDFNNMLGVILGHADLALERLNPAEPIYGAIAEIRSAATRSAELTRQLLAFARKQAVVPRVLDLNATVAGLLNMLHRLIGEDVDLVWRPAADLWPVRVDPTQIDQILTNLCVNARDAIADVGQVTIETQATSFDEAYCASHPGHTPGDYVRLAVSDNGSGMDEDTRSHLFEPFFTTKAMGKGTGLGLATVYGIVKQNDGVIAVESEPGHGTTFAIYLPHHVGQTEPAQPDRAAEPSVRARETILLVEDETAVLRLTTKMLEWKGYSVLAASTPGEAIRLAREHTDPIHLLMTDVIMPGMNGRDLARDLMSLRPHLKCLFTSGYTADVIAHHGVLDEGVQFIQKPFSLDSLAAKVREALSATPSA